MNVPAILIAETLNNYIMEDEAVAIDLIEKLRKALDLTLYEAKLYVALLQGASNPREASALSGVPLPRIYDVVRVLEAKGMAIRDPNGWYKPLSPRAVATAIIARIEEESRKRTSLILEVADKLEELTYRKTEPGASTIRNTFAIISTLIDSMKDDDRIYIVAVDVLLRHRIILKKLIDTLAPIIGDIRLLSPTSIAINEIEIYIETGSLKVREYKHAVVDLVASRRSYMIITEDPIDKIPLGLVVRGGRENRVYKAMEEIWQSHK